MKNNCCEYFDCDSQTYLLDLTDENYKSKYLFLILFRDAGISMWYVCKEAHSTLFD